MNIAKKLLITNWNTYIFCDVVFIGKVIKSGTYNWLTGESMDTYAHAGPSEESFLGSFSGTTEKSYLYALKGSSKASAKEIHTVSEAKKKDDKSKLITVKI